MTGIDPRRISFGNDVKLGKTNNTPTQDKTIDLTLLSKDEDLESINKFIADIEKSDDKSVDIKSWNIKVSDQYIDLSSNPKEALKIMKDLKKSIENSDTKFKGDIKLNGKDPLEIFFKQVNINTSFTNQKFGEHDTDGYTLNPVDNTILNVFTEDSDRVNDIVVGSPLNVFSSVTDAENFAKKEKGTEIILKNKDNLYVVYQVNRKENSREYKSSDNSSITADNFTENHSRFNKDFLKNVQASKGFMITDDNKTLEIAGQTGVEVDKADYSVVKADMQLRMVDINGIQNTNGLYDWQGTLNGVVSIDVKAKMEEVLNKLDLPKGTRVNVDYDEKDKSFLVKLNYEIVSERIGELTALKIKPNENGSLSISSFGVLNANLNLTDGVAVSAGVDLPFLPAVNANGSVSMKENDKISANAGVSVTTTPLIPFNPVGFNFGAKFNPDMTKGENNKYQVNPNLGSDKNVFIPIETKGILIPDFVEDKTAEWENSAHKTIASSIISVAESMEKAGFIVPKELKDVKSRISSWGTNPAQDKKDKQVINDFVNGKIKLEYDLSKQMNLKGFPNASINQFDPNIKFDTDGKKLNIVFDNSKLIASSDGLAKEKAVTDTPDGLSVNASVNLNNTTASVKSDAHLELNVSEKERKDFSNKLEEMGFNPSKADISGKLTVDAKLNSKLENTNDLSKINAQATIDVKANDVNIYVPNTETRITLNKADAKGNLEVVQDGKNTSLKAGTEVSLSGFKVSQKNENLVSLQGAKFKGNLSYKAIETINEDKQKSTKTQVIVQGRLDVNKGKYDNFTAEKLAVDGLVAYTEREGVSFSGATTEAALKVSGHIKNPDMKTDLHIKNITGYGKIDVDQNGNIKNAEIKAGGYKGSTFSVSGKVNDKELIVDADLKLKGSIKVNQDGEKISLNVNGSINQLKLGDINLENVNNINSSLVYDSKTNTVTITSKNDKDLDISGKINGEDFVFKGDKTITFQFDKTTGKLSFIPTAKVELLKVGTFELKEAELSGSKLSIIPTDNNSKITLESVEGQDIQLKGKFINAKQETPVDIKGKGSIEINTEKINNKNVYSVTSNTSFEKFQIGDTFFKDASLEGKVTYDGQNITLSSADNNGYLKLKATQVNVHTNKENILDFEAKGNLSLVPDKDNKSGFSLSCKEVELKKGVINNYLIEDGKLNGKIVYARDEEERSLKFEGLDDKNPQLNLSGKLTKTYQENGEDKKYVAQISDLGINGGIVFEQNKLKFTDIKTDVKGSINGVDINNVLVTNTNPDGSTDITLTGDTDGLNFGGSIKFKQDEKGNMIITSAAEKGSLKMGFGSKDDIIKILDDLVKINSIKSSAQLTRDIDNIKQQLAAFSTLNVSADLQKFNIVYDPKSKHLNLTSDLEGKMGSKILIDNKNTDIDVKSVDIQGKLVADTETKQLQINEGIMKGTTSNIEEMVLESLSNAGVIPKDYKIDDKNKVVFNQGKNQVNIDLDKTGIGDDSRITMKTGVKVAGVNVNMRLSTKITVENIAPEGQPPKNVLKVHIDKSRAGGIINSIDLNGKAKLFGFIPLNLNKSIHGNKTPYLDYIETLDISKENSKDGYEQVKKQKIEEFSKTLAPNLNETERNKKVNKYLKENNLQSFDEYQKHYGVVQLQDNKTVLFDLSEYLKIKTGGQVNFEIEPSQNILSGDENEDHFQLGFKVVVNDLGNPVADLPKDDNAAKNLGNTLEQIPDILEQTTNVFEQTNNIATGINKTTNNTVEQTIKQTDNTLKQMKGINNQVKSTINQVKPK
ncbi:MAG: hypothetical protein U0354_11040 [Candidatus Sericytochromatia bacterium]